MLYGSNVTTITYTIIVVKYYINVGDITFSLGNSTVLFFPERDAIDDRRFLHCSSKEFTSSPILLVIVSPTTECISFYRQGRNKCHITYMYVIKITVEYKIQYIHQVSLKSSGIIQG